MLFPVIFIAITILTAGIGLYISALSYQKNSITGRFLCFTTLASSITNISYLLAIFLDQYFLMSLFMSIYFASIDVMLYCLLGFVHYYAKLKDTAFSRKVKVVLTTYMYFDIAILMLNPFKELSITYEYVRDGIGSYDFEMLPLYQMHLAFSYLLIVLTLYRLVEKVLNTPSVYRKQFMMTVYGIIAVVVYNAVYLFSSRSSAFDFLDYSIWGYSFCSIFIYWNCYQYSTHGMMNYFRNWVLESVNQGIVLFDYENNLLAHNDNAEELFPENSFDEHVTLEQFLKECQISPENIAVDGKHSFQCFKHNGEVLSPVRCDYQALKSDANEVLGRLFVFTDSHNELDLLTGFHSWEHFQKVVVSNHKPAYQSPITAAICDINGLQNINDQMGRNIGDRAIAILAGILKQVFPSRTYFIRGNEASLICLCFGDSTEEEIQHKLKHVQKLYNENTELGCFLDIQSAVCHIDQNQPDVISAIHTAERGMKAKKLLDKNSSHSELMTSLICALQETDHDTEAHVQRTQIMGTRLAKRMGLSDLEQSSLSLLCILHDIGKIGIPLEILNKPGKLTDTEWAVLKTHVEKGYQIVKSSQDLSGIATMVRHHHERWDGHGYPDGLKGEDIPLLSRIISVVDAYDAMVNDRSYRAARSSAEAIAELKRCSGTQFDPNVTAAFIELLESEPVILELSTQKNVLIETEKETTVSESAEPEHIPSLTNTVHPLLFSRYVIGPDSTIISADDNFEVLTGYSKEDYKAHPLTQEDLIFPADRMDYFRQVAEQLAKQPIAFFEHRLRKKDGALLYVFCYGKQFFDSASRTSCTEIIITDSANTYSMRTIINKEYEKAHTRLNEWEKQYPYDSLTELLRFDAFQNIASEKLSSENQKAVMLVMDIDQFMDYNNHYGTHAGDEFLILVAQTIQNTLRKYDAACRVQGDSFATILFYDTSVSEKIMIDRAQQICDKINLTLSAQAGNTSLSMGAAFRKDGVRSFSELYNAAGHALQQSKKLGRAMLTIYSQE